MKAAVPQESEEWTAAALSAALKLPISTLRRRMVYWQSQVHINAYLGWNTGIQKGHTIGVEKKRRAARGGGGIGPKYRPLWQRG
jgi:hypothetical protein